MKWLFEIDPSKRRTNGLKAPLRNIVDKPLYKLVERFCETIYVRADHYIVPNTLTTASLLVRLYGIVSFQEDSRKTAGACFALGYFLDCADGFYARKYNKCTPIGCIYDHLNDIITCSIYAIIAIRKKMWGTILLLCLLVVFTINQILHDEECVQDRTPFFEFICTRLCMFKIFETNDFIYLFGTSTWVVLVSLAIMFEK